MKKSKLEFSIVIPCYNEEDAINQTLDEIISTLPKNRQYEILVVNDGSTDNTGSILEELVPTLDRVRVIDHESNRGYGAALKTGIRAAESEIVVTTDADGSYPNARIAELVDLCAHYDMVVGARIGKNIQYSKIRAFPKFFLKIWVSWLSMRNVPDINSGLRVFRKNVAEQFIGILSDRFSFTITITLAMLTTYCPTLFVPIDYYPRIGESKIKPIRDTLRFIGLILRTGTYFAPVRAFAPIFVGLFALSILSLVHDIFVLQDLTDKTVILFLFLLNTGMFILVADMLDKRLK
jgi:glycosyltransferase involved in cell wall biosynthesis